MTFHARFSAKSELLRVLLMTIAIAIATPWLAGVARADEGAEEIITVSLTADCSSVPDTPEAREALTKYKLCGYGQEPGEASPMSTVVGNCGTLSLNVFNSGGGNMLWKAEMNSSVGPMAFASYTGDWLNTSRGVSGGVTRSTGLNGGGWLDTLNVYTQAGSVWAKINAASLTTVYGLVCVNNKWPASSTNVTN